MKTLLEQLLDDPETGPRLEALAREFERKTNPMNKEATAEVWIPLTQGKVTVIDFDDFEKVRPYKWYAHKNGNTFYAERNTIAKQKTSLLLHKEIMQPGEGLEVDHIDGNGLNNRRSNLRNVTHQQNLFNQKLRTNKTSKFRGVSFENRKLPWRASIRTGNKTLHIGNFVSEEAAARAFDAAAIKLRREFAKLNFPL